MIALANPISKLACQAQRIAVYGKARQPVVKLGLIVTLYFRDGHTPAVRQRVDECFQRFFQEFRLQLKWQLHNRVSKISAAVFNRTRQKILHSDPTERHWWLIASGDGAHCPADYRMAVMQVGEGQNAQECSCLKLVLPWAFLAEPQGVQRYERWLYYLAEQVQAEHGYGGLACILPYESDPYTPHEYQHAQYYRALLVDTQPQLDTLQMKAHIKSVSWQTILGARFVKRLGGNDALRRRLSHYPEVTFTRYSAGLVVRCGKLPDLAARSDGAVPVAYLAVNAAIKSLRIAEPGSLHNCSWWGAVFDKISTRRWYARFDLQPPKRLRAGEQCSQAGFWFSSARINTRRHFEKGEIMPSFEHLPEALTHWFWADAMD